MINRELHTCLTFYRSTPWLISKTLNLFTNLNRFIYNIYTSLPNSSWNAVAPWSTLGAPAEHQTSDASIGYPPGLTGERLISFARNTISRTFAKTLFTGGAKHYSLVLQLISFTNKQNRNTVNFANTIHGPAKTLFKNPKDYTRNTYDFL